MHSFRYDWELFEGSTFKAFAVDSQERYAGASVEKTVTDVCCRNESRRSLTWGLLRGAKSVRLFRSQWPETSTGPIYERTTSGIVLLRRPMSSWYLRRLLSIYGVKFEGRNELPILFNAVSFTMCSDYMGMQLCQLQDSWSLAVKIDYSNHLWPPSVLLAAAWLFLPGYGVSWVWVGF